MKFFVASLRQIVTEKYAFNLLLKGSFSLTLLIFFATNANLPRVNFARVESRNSPTATKELKNLTILLIELHYIFVILQVRKRSLSLSI